MASKQEVIDTLELFILACLKGDLINVGFAIELWAETDAALLRAAALAWIKTSKFMPTVAELTPLIGAEELRRAWANTNTNSPGITEEEIFELELWRLAQSEPRCSKCMGGSYVTNDEQELSCLAYRELHNALPTPEELKRCDAGCIGGHVKPSEHVIASLRSRFFKQPQPTTTTRKKR